MVRSGSQGTSHSTVLEGCVGTATGAIAADGVYTAVVPRGTYAISLVPDKPPLAQNNEDVRRSYLLGPSLELGDADVLRDYDVKTIPIEGEVVSRGERGIVQGQVELREWKRTIGPRAWASKEIGAEPSFLFRTFPGPHLLGVRLADVDGTRFWPNRDFPFDAERSLSKQRPDEVRVGVLEGERHVDNHTPAAGRRPHA